MSGGMQGPPEKAGPILQLAPCRMGAAPATACTAAAAAALLQELSKVLPAYGLALPPKCVLRIDSMGSSEAGLAVSALTVPLPTT